MLHNAWELCDCREVALLPYGVWVGLFGEGVDEGEVVGKDGEGGGLKQVMEVPGGQVDQKEFSIEARLPGLCWQQLPTEEGHGEGMPLMSCSSKAPTGHLTCIGRQL